MEHLFRVFLVIIFTVNSVHFSFSQNGVPPLKKMLHVDLGIFTSTLNYEIPVSRKTSLNLFGGLDYLIAGGYYNNMRYSNVGFTTKYGAEAKFYINRQRRFDKGLVTDYNSGSFIALQSAYRNTYWIKESERLNAFNGLTVSALFGFKRYLGKKFYFETRVGAGYGREAQNYRFTGENFVRPEIDLKIGYILSK